ncbi:hypothetical protein DOY81_010949, partial [Sarcophaga bullata]
FTTNSTARENVQMYKNSSNSVVLKEFKDTFNRFRLTGPLAQSVLNKAFKIKSLNFEQNNSWLKEAKHNKNFVDYNEQQQQFWKKCEEFITSPAELLSNMILALNIEDPRLNRPQKRTKAVCESKSHEFYNYNDLLDVQPSLSSSVLWNEALRNRITSDMLSTHEYCALRSQHVIVPGRSCSFEESMQPVPVLLIQRPGSSDGAYKRLGYGCGWDVIAPAGYGMSIWLSLIMWGARPGGLREFNSLAREMGTEEHLPDTVAERQKLQDLAECVKRCNLLKFPLDLNSNCLIQIKLTMKCRGNPKDFALLCLPSRKDLKRNLKQIKFNNREPVYIEPLLKDPNEKERCNLRIQHKKLLKRLRAQRVREKRKKQETSCTRVYIRPAGTSAICLEQFKRMCKLWLPEDTSTLFSVRKQATRDCFGYASTASFCLTEGTVGAIGYVTVEGLKQLLKLSQQCL